MSHNEDNKEKRMVLESTLTNHEHSQVNEVIRRRNNRQVQEHIHSREEWTKEYRIGCIRRYKINPEIKRFYHETSIRASVQKDRPKLVTTLIEVIQNFNSED